VPEQALERESVAGPQSPLAVEAVPEAVRAKLATAPCGAGGAAQHAPGCLHRPGPHVHVGEEPLWIGYAHRLQEGGASVQAALGLGADRCAERHEARRAGLAQDRLLRSRGQRHQMRGATTSPSRQASTGRTP
jgi:hypothetical protein